MTSDDLQAFSDAARSLGLKYNAFHAKASTGDFGPVERRGGRLFVTSAGLRAYRARTSEPSFINPQLISEALEDVQDIREIGARYLVCTLRQADLLEGLRAEYLSAVNQGKTIRAEVIALQLVALPQAQAVRDEKGVWRIVHPDHDLIGLEESPSRDEVAR